LLEREEDAEDEDKWARSFDAQLQGDVVDEELEDFQFKLPEGF
jgi:hypothetical protein